LNLRAAGIDRLGRDIRISVVSDDEKGTAAGWKMISAGLLENRVQRYPPGAVLLLTGCLSIACTAGDRTEKPAVGVTQQTAADLALPSGADGRASGKEDVESRGVPNPDRPIVPPKDKFAPLPSSPQSGPQFTPVAPAPPPPLTVAPVLVVPEFLSERFAMPVPCEGRPLCWLSRRGAGSPEESFFYFYTLGFAQCSGKGLSCDQQFTDSLNAFRVRNGFAAGQGEVRATYFNNIDLRIGRDMHCRRNAGGIACYVSNYGPPAFLNGGANPAYPDPHAALTEAVLAAGGLIPPGSLQQPSTGALGAPRGSANVRPSTGTGSTPTLSKPLATVAMEYYRAPPSKTVAVRERDGLFTQSNPEVCIGSRSDGPPSRQDVDTGIDVMPGDVIEFSATGSIWGGECLTGNNGPSGWGPRPDNPKLPIKNASPFGLIGRIGQPNDAGAYSDVDCVKTYDEYGQSPPCKPRPSYFFIGDRNANQVRARGRLYLRVNDDRPGNGVGSFVVSITVQRQVTFYVYDQDGRLVPNVALDREGPKFVPHMCLACHGGTYDDATHTVRGASFLPFDVYNFLYYEGPGFRRVDQEVKFRDLNLLVAETGPGKDNPNRPIARMIDGMYRAPNGMANTTAVQYVPAGWRGHEDLYRDFVGKYCRLCHMAQPARIDFETYDNFKQSNPGAAICRFGTMPHAQGPYDHLATGRYSAKVGDELRVLGVGCIKKS